MHHGPIRRNFAIMAHHCQDGYTRQRNSNVATEVGLEGRKATHGGDQRGESTARVWTKLLADLCGYPGQSGQRRLCACQNRETLLDDGVYWTPGTKQRNLLRDGILWFVRPQNEKEIDVLSKVNDAEIAHYTLPGAITAPAPIHGSVHIRG